MMGSRSNECFGDLNPRIAPVARTFSDSHLAALVPEVSLVFSSSSTTSKETVQDVPQNRAVRFQNSSSLEDKTNSHENFDVTYGKKSEAKCNVISSNMFSPRNRYSVTNVGESTGFTCENRKLQKKSLRDNNTLPYVNSRYETDKQRLSPQNWGCNMKHPVLYPSSNKNYGRTELTQEYHVTESNVMPNRGHNLANMIHMDHLSERVSAYPQAAVVERRGVGDTCHDHVMHSGYEECHINCNCRSSSKKNYLNKSTSVEEMANGHSHASVRRGFCTPQHLQNHQNFKNSSSHYVSDFASIDSAVNIKCSRNNEHFCREYEVYRHNCCPSSALSPIQHKNGVHECSTNSNVDNKSYGRVNLDKESVVKFPNSLSSDHFEAKGTELPQTNKASDSSSKCHSHIGQSPQSCRQNCSNTSLLQEIVLMNQKQCTILQGLLQQVVAMQTDQMKILGEINEKLDNSNALKEASQRQHDDCSDIQISSKSENVATQTTMVEEGESYKMDNEQKKNCTSSPKNDLFRKASKPQTSQEKRVYSDNGNHMQNEVIQEEEQKKIKKFPERGISWSAIHDVETVEESFTLHGVCVPTVVEQMPSSVHTMHLHVQDYHSSASYDSIVESRHVSDIKCSNENGQDSRKGSWTLYDNIVGHVKKFLQVVPGDKNCNSGQKTSQVEAIRFATIEKIRQLGVSVYENSTEITEVGAAGRIHFDSKVNCSSLVEVLPSGDNSSSDASLEIHTLAMKYLQEDDVSDLTKWKQDCRTPTALQGGQMSANISLATQHYLEKYHLLPLGIDPKEKKQALGNCGPCGAENNILDITTLKKQPKLL